MGIEPAPEPLRTGPRKDGRGRPPSFSADERAYLAGLIRQHGIRGTQRVSEIHISIGTLIKIRREFSVQLPKGRGRAAA